jgi:hypothetical protein
MKMAAFVIFTERGKEMAWTPKETLEAGELMIFRPLTDEEEQQFRQYAREHREEVEKLGKLAHPVCREELAKNSA